MINKQRVEEEKQDNHANLVMKQSMPSHNAFMVIDHSILAEIERNGFPKQYTTTSLEKDELNYATAYYFLLGTPKEY